MACFCSSFFVLAVFVLAVFVLAVLILAAFELAVSSANGEAKAKTICGTSKNKTLPNSGAKVEASPNGGATGSECKRQFPYVFPFEASPNSGVKVEASPNSGATGSECKSQVPYVFPFEAFAQQRGQG